MSRNLRHLIAILYIIEKVKSGCLVEHLQDQADATHIIGIVYVNQSFHIPQKNHSIAKQQMAIDSTSVATVSGGIRPVFQVPPESAYYQCDASRLEGVASYYNYHLITKLAILDGNTKHFIVVSAAENLF